MSNQPSSASDPSVSSDLSDPSSGGLAPDSQRLQREIIAALGVRPRIDPAAEIESRVQFLADYVRRAGARALVLGISGGIDSTVAGRLSQLAAERLRAQGHDAQFVAVRLPYGRQRDEADAQAALRFIAPDRAVEVNIEAASDGMLAELERGALAFADAAQRDFVFGNVKARQRMIAQYAIAGALSGLVVGTDQAAEALMGFFTKHGDGACDLVPLTGLTKRQVRAIGAALGASAALVDKVPTADLEELRPLRPDEDAYGVRYDQIDDFLEGRPIDPGAARIILRQYAVTAHKRALPVAPPHVAASAGGGQGA